MPFIVLKNSKTKKKNDKNSMKNDFSISIENKNPEQTKAIKLIIIYDFKIFLKARLALSLFNFSDCLSGLNNIRNE